MAERRTPALSIARRDLLKSALVGFGASLGLPSWAAQTTPDRDRFGGWTGLRFDATGFFRTEHDGRRWWLVTPEGHAFISWYTDLVNTQHYARWEGQRETMDRLTDTVGQPFLNGDAAYTTPTATMPNPHGQHARDMAERALWTREFMENATARPDFVGWQMCGMIDTANTMPGKEQAQHQGLMTTRGEFYPEMEEAVRNISDRLYVLATGKA